MSWIRWLSFSKTILSCVIDSLLTSNFDIKTVNDINKLAKDFINIQDSLTTTYNLLSYLVRDLTDYESKWN